MPDTSQTSSGKVRILATRKFTLTGDVIGNSTYNRATGTVIDPDNYADKKHNHSLNEINGLIDALENLSTNFNDTVLTGHPTATTPNPSSNDNSVATTEFVQNLLAGFTIDASNITNLNLHRIATTGNYNDLNNKPTSLPANGGTADRANSVTTTLNASSNNNLNVWFSSTEGIGRMSYDNDFLYNPNTNTLKVANINGNASTATLAAKATADKNNNDITSTYISNVTIEGTKITFYKGDGTSFYKNTQDTNTEYVNATPTGAGLMSAIDKEKLDTVDRNANFYELPEASKFRLGGVQIGNGINIDNGVISISKEGISNLGFTPTDQLGNVGGISGSVSLEDIPTASENNDGLLTSEDKVNLDDLVDNKLTIETQSIVNRNILTDEIYAGAEEITKQSNVVLLHDNSLIFPITTVNNVEGAVKKVNNISPDSSGNVDVVFNVERIETSLPLNINTTNGLATNVGGDLNVSGKLTISGEIIETTQNIILNTVWNIINLPNPLETNSYYIQIIVDNSSMYSGVISWLEGATSQPNNSNEILLHGINNGSERIFLRTYYSVDEQNEQNNKFVLQIASSIDHETASEVKFKFKKIF